jgi:hypothetical protein
LTGPRLVSTGELPARVAREISGGARQWVETNPEVYRALARRHAAGIRPLTGPAPIPDSPG